MVAAKGYHVFDPDPAVLDWAQAARKVGETVLAQGGDLRHGKTWFVGVDALPNAKDGSVAGVPLGGGWLDHVTPPEVWHAAQLSVIFPGYPVRDADESDAAHRFRRRRDAAHVDGLLPIGPDRRRYLREPHQFIAGLPLNACDDSPLVVWPGSHVIMGQAFATAFKATAPAQWPQIDVTEIYQEARRRVFETCARVTLTAKPGQVMLLHRHIVHGVAPWDGREAAAPYRMVAYFRPQGPIADWL